VVGLDCEWEPALGGKTPNPVSTVQLSLPDGTAALFHLQRKQKIPFSPHLCKRFWRILTSRRCVFVGVNVNLDASYLVRDYKVEVANTVDLRTHARQCLVETPSRSLAGMVSALIGKTLRKDPAIRLSQWSSHQLTPEQARNKSTRDYACRDAYASVLVYQTIENLKDPIR
ncbi:unnamed protein product, partial [Laminaria digitata]